MKLFNFCTKVIICLGFFLLFFCLIGWYGGVVLVFWVFFSFALNHTSEGKNYNPIYVITKCECGGICRSSNDYRIFRKVFYWNQQNHIFSPQTTVFASNSSSSCMAATKIFHSFELILVYRVFCSIFRLRRYSRKVWQASLGGILVS